MSFANCETCRKLITAYDAAMTAYAQSSKQLLHLVNNHFADNAFAQAWDRCETLSHACGSARRDLYQHVSSDHQISLQCS